MIHRSPHVFLLSLALVATGCVDNNTSFFIDGNVVPDDADCTLDPSNDLLLDGLYDVGLAAAGLAGPYFLYPRYNNAMQNRANHLATDPNGVLLQEAEIELLLPDGTPIDFGGLPNPYSVPISTYAFSSTSEGEVQQTVGSIPAILTDYAAGLLGTINLGGSRVVVVSVIVRGETGGGTDVEPGPWLYNVELCDRCITPRCAIGSEVATIACNPGQDSSTLFDCECQLDVDCDDMNECTVNTCSSNACGVANAPDGTPCTDGGTTCTNGACT